MPFRSKSQQRFMFATNPKLARKFADETKDFKKLPEKVKTAMLSSFSKIAKEMFDPMKNPPVRPETQAANAINQAKEQKMKGLTPSQHRTEMTMRRSGIANKNRQTRKKKD